MLKFSAGDINNIIVFVNLTVPQNLLFCIKISNNEIFVFKIIILAYKHISMNVEEGGLHAHTQYNPDAWGSTTTEQGTRVSRRLAEDQVIGENRSIEPPLAPPALQTIDVPTGSATVAQVSGDVVSLVSLGTEPMETCNIAPGNKTGSPFVETNSNAFENTHRPSGDPTGKKSATTIQDRLLIRTPVELNFKVRKTGKYTGLKLY